MPPLSPTTNWSSNTYYQTMPLKNDLNNSAFMMESNHSRFAGKYTAVVRQKIQDLEGPNFCYKPLFTSHTAHEVQIFV